jgi:hypothetical protein
MKNLLIAFALSFGASQSIAQQDEYESMPYVLGDIMVMLDHNKNLDDLIETHQFIDGVQTELTVTEVLSEPSNIWLLHFNHEVISHLKMIIALDADEHVKIVQHNHFVTDRATAPNDPNYGSQWQHQNVDSELAWDITTGGQTALGDDIVVCVLEGGGSDWDHPDLVDNHWVNEVEANGTNGVDDDGNGYVDDIDGWNLGSGGSDNIAEGSHGTGVSGMIGATGNNGSVVAGANWTVKIMQVDMSGSISNEANVINAYTYPLVMRQMYNNSDGSEGAFVVATNASWGIDNGDPASAPLWCAFYDTLGLYGILNFGATANNNVNIDVVGDLPTACGSDYMISVTATNSADERTFSGYGQTTIDLGAPGEAIITTSNGGGSGSTSGTSFATPFTAGVCGLIYSHPCSNISTIAAQDPQGAADIVRATILDGVDPVSNLTTETVTGGRLNSYNSLLELEVTAPGPSATIVSTTAEQFGSDGEIEIAVSGGTAPYSFSWTGPGGFTSATEDLSGLDGGDYDLVLTDGNGCVFNIDDVTVNSSSAGLNENGLVYQMYPNPTDNELNILLPNDVEMNMVFFDNTGRQVLNRKLTSTANTVDVSHLSSGIYLIQLTNDQGDRSLSKIIIE